MNMQIRPVSDRRKVLNYINTDSKPFSADMVVMDTGVDRKLVTCYLRQYELKRIIKKIKKHGNSWIYSKKFSSDHNFDLFSSIIIADKIEKHIKSEGYSSLREIAQKLKCSHEFVRFVILERNLIDFNKEKTLKKEQKAIQKRLLKILRAGTHFLKIERQRSFLESIKPFSSRG